MDYSILLPLLIALASYVYPSRYRYLLLSLARAYLVYDPIISSLAAILSLGGFLLYDYLAFSRTYLITLAISLVVLAIGLLVTYAYRPFLIFIPLFVYVPITRVDETILGATLIIITLVSVFIVALFDPSKTPYYLSGAISYLLMLPSKELRENF